MNWLSVGDQIKTRQGQFRGKEGADPRLRRDAIGSPVSSRDHMHMGSD